MFRVRNKDYYYYLTTLRNILGNLNHPNYLNGIVIIFKIDCNVKVSYIITFAIIIHIDFFFFFTN